jgi:hypothetical protein
LQAGAEMKITIGACFPAKWNMNVNTSQQAKNNIDNELIKELLQALSTLKGTQ